MLHKLSQLFDSSIKETSTQSLLFGEAATQNTKAATIAKPLHLKPLPDTFVLFHNTHALPVDIWRLILSFCSLGTRKLLLQLNSHFFNFVLQVDEEYKLYACLNVFAPLPAYYYEPVEHMKPTHLYLPSAKFVQQEAHRVLHMIRYVEPEEPQTECLHLPTPPQMHNILSNMILQAPQYVTEEEAQDVLVMLMKYVPWKADMLVNHPFSKIAAMAKLGMKLHSNQGVNWAQVQKIVPEIEDFANCCIYPANATEDYLFSGQQHGFSTLGQALYKSSKLNNTVPFSEVYYLTQLRAQAYVYISVSGPPKLKNPESVQFLLHNKVFHYIDPELLSNVQFVTQAILLQPMVLNHVPKEIQQDEQVIRHAIRNGKFECLLYTSYYLQHKYFCAFLRGLAANTSAKLHEEWYDNDHVMKILLCLNGNQMAHASARIKNCKPLAMIGARQSPQSYTYISAALQQDLELVQTMLQSHGLSCITHVPATVIAQHAKLQQLVQVYHNYHYSSQYSKYPVSLESYLGKNKIVLDLNLV